LLEAVLALLEADLIQLVSGLVSLEAVLIEL